MILTLVILGGVLALWAATTCWAITSLSVTVTAGFNWTAANTLTGSDYGQNQNSSNLRKTLSMGTSAANAAAGGADQLYSAITSLAGGASASIDLTSLSNILAATGQSFARVKAIMVRLLSTTDDSSIGTAATSVKIDNTVANALSSQSGAGWFANANEGTATGGAGDATGSKFEIANGGVLLWATPSAAGLVVDGTHKIIKLTNIDGAVTAKVQVTVGGGSS